MKFLCAILLLLMAVAAVANAPGGHMVQLTWTDSWCTSGANGSCTYNVYRGVGTSACKTGAAPFVSGITALAYEDDTIVAGTTYVYNVTAMPSTGGESACSSSAQIAVSSVSAGPITSLQGSAH